MKTILFSTDFSASTQVALGWAKFFARQYKATLILFHVQQIPLPDSTPLPTAGEFGMGTYNPGLMLDLEPIDRERLETLSAQLTAEGFTCQTELRWGAVADTVRSAASDLHVDLIIAGRSHLGNFFERLIGTEATSIARDAPCPVLVVPDEAMPPTHVETILFSTALATEESTEFSQALAVAQTIGAHLSVLHVHAANEPELAAGEFIGQLQQLYGQSPLRTETVKAATVIDGIESYLKTTRPDLLVMVSRDRDFLSRLFNPSHTDRMVLVSDTPMLIYHAHPDKTYIPAR